ncbi:MAG: hypothetical protein J5661_05325 [Bacteroidaceae bacterium]|nr:hypothetical protein [Bacteroidaceae bacterium]
MKEKKTREAIFSEKWGQNTDFNIFLKIFFHPRQKVSMGTRGGQNRMSPVFMGSRGHFSMPKIFHGQSLQALFFSCNFAAEFNYNRNESTQIVFFVVCRTCSFASSPASIFKKNL